MSDISLNNVQWGATLFLNFLRSLAAGIVWFVIMLLMHFPLEEAASMLLLPILYLSILMPIGIVAIFLTKAGVPFVWFFSLMAAIAIIVGDPILFLINLIKPGLLRVQYYSPLNFNLIVFVTY